MAEHDLLRLGGEPLDHLLVDAALDVEPRPRAADLALVHEDRGERPLHRVVEVGVGEHDVRALAAQLEVHRMQGLHRRLEDAAAGGGAAGEAHRVDAGVLGDRLPGLAAQAGDDVDHAVGEARLGDELAETQRAERGVLRGLEHDGVPRRQRGPELQAGEKEGKVPGDDAADDAVRLAPGVGEGRAHHRRHRQGLAVDLRRPAAVVAIDLAGHRHVDVLRLGERLADVEGLDGGELLGVLVDEVGEPEQAAAAGARVEVAPDVLEGGAGGADGPVDVGRRPRGDGGEHLAGGRVERLDGGVGLGVDPVAADEQLPGQTVDQRRLGAAWPGVDRHGLPPRGTDSRSRLRTVWPRRVPGHPHSPQGLCERGMPPCHPPFFESGRRVAGLGFRDPRRILVVAANSIDGVVRRPRAAAMSGGI